MKYVFGTVVLLLLSVALLLPVDRGGAQEPPATALGRPTLRSTGLPPVIQQTPRQATPRVITNTPSTTPSPPPTATLSPTPTASATRTPSATASPSATRTPTGTPTPSVTHTPSVTTSPTQTYSATATASATASPTVTTTSSNTPTHTSTPSPSATPSATQTPEPISVTNQNAPVGDVGAAPTLSPPILAGMIGLGVFSLYVLLYALNSAAMDRYATGFIVPSCPVCEDGMLEIEERPYRSLGIPRVRRTARCDNCRSVLREVGRRRWRYSVDPHANQTLFREYNNRILNENDLLNLAQGNEAPAAQPRYLDDDRDPGGE